jgi:hypothetical protein
VLHSAASNNYATPNDASGFYFSRIDNRYQFCFGKSKSRNNELPLAAHALWIGRKRAPTGSQKAAKTEGESGFRGEYGRQKKKSLTLA